MAMALMEDGEVDEGLYDEMLLAAMDAAALRKFGRPVQQQQQQPKHHHPPPPLGFSAPQKKLMITSHVPSPGNQGNEPENFKPPPGVMREVVVAKADQRFQSFVKAPASAINNFKPPLASYMKNGEAGTDMKANGGGGFVSKNAGAVWSGGGDLKHNGGSSSAAVWTERSPLQELQPWAKERPSSTTVWVHAAEEPKDRTVPWSSSLSGVAMFKECQDAAMRTLVPSDYTMLQGKPYIKKAGWRKIAFFFDISFEIKEKNIQFDQQSNVLRAEFVVRASMTSGRFTDSWGSCDRGEKRFSKPNHDIPSTAETRAKTRACQDLLGIGEYKLDGAHH